MKKFYKKSSLFRKFLVCLGVALPLLWLSAGMPEARQAEAHANSSASGADDILLLGKPSSVSELVTRWHPTEELDELRLVILEDKIRELLSCYPRFIDPQEQEHLARMLVAEGQRTGIDPLFLAAVIRVESAFSTDAVSNKGARGLMQVMPATAEELATKLGIDWIGPQQLHDPEINVRMGVYYLQWLLSLYAGDYKFALTAYNRGPASVGFIVRQHGKLKFRFTEYFRKINNTYRLYVLRSLAGPGAAILHMG